MSSSFGTWLAAAIAAALIKITAGAPSLENGHRCSGYRPLCHPLFRSNEPIHPTMKLWHQHFMMILQVRSTVAVVVGRRAAEPEMGESEMFVAAAAPPLPAGFLTCVTHSLTDLQEDFGCLVNR